ncbi:hypothetical protein MNBD_GAMMA11-2992, partial [hydrothermal vent metagenome]
VLASLTTVKLMGIAEAVEVYNKVADAINAQALKLFEIIFIWDFP